MTYAVTSRATWRTTTRSPTREMCETARTMISRRAGRPSGSAARTNPPTTRRPYPPPHDDGRGRLGLESWGSGSDLEDEEDEDSPAPRGADSSATASKREGAANEEEEAEDGEERRRGSGHRSGPSRINAIVGARALGRRERRVGVPHTEQRRAAAPARSRCRSLRTGPLRPMKVSPKRSVPKIGWLCPLLDYARTGWPEAEFGSSLQYKLEVKTPEQLAKMRGVFARAGRHGCRRRRHQTRRSPTNSTGYATRALMNGVYPSPRNYMGFPTLVHLRERGGVPRDSDARPLEDGDIVNRDITVCLNGYHGDLNETPWSGPKFRPGTRVEGQGAAPWSVWNSRWRGVPGAVRGSGRGDTDARQRAWYGG